MLRYNKLTGFCHLGRCFDRFPDRLFLSSLASACPPLALPPNFSFRSIAVQNDTPGSPIPQISEEDVRADICGPPSPCGPGLFCLFDTNISTVRWKRTVYSKNPFRLRLIFEPFHRRRRKVEAGRDKRITRCAVMSRTDQSSICTTWMGRNVSEYFWHHPKIQPGQSALGEQFILCWRTPSEPWPSPNQNSPQAQHWSSWVMQPLDWIRTIQKETLYYSI